MRMYFCLQNIFDTVLVLTNLVFRILLSNAQQESHPSVRHFDFDEKSTDEGKDFNVETDSLSSINFLPSIKESSVQEQEFPDERVQENRNFESNMLEQLRLSIFNLSQQLSEVRKENDKLKAEKEESQEKESRHQKAKSAILIQSWYRCHRARHSYNRIKRSILTIQSRHRGATAREQYKLERRSIITIQSFVRMIIKRMDFLLKREVLHDDNLQYR